MASDYEKNLDTLRQMFSVILEDGEYERWDEFHSYPCDAITNGASDKCVTEVCIIENTFLQDSEDDSIGARFQMLVKYEDDTTKKANIIAIYKFDKQHKITSIHRVIQWD